MKHEVLDALLARRRPVLLDGATGTELARRGVDTTLPLWSARALFDDPGLETLTKIHQDYARAGAEVLVTNTFRTTRRALERAGKGGAWREANRRAIACARLGAAAAGRPCLVAGGLAPLEDCYRPDLVPDADVCASEHRIQAALLAELGADLLFIETMNSGREAEAALLAARETGLPVLLSLCPREPRHLLSGEPLDEVVKHLAGLGGEALRAILVNCATPEAMQVVFPPFMRAAPGLPHGLYAHLGEPDEVTGWRLPENHEPQAYASWMRLRLDEGARLIGGCCGTTPDHTAALARLVDSIPS
ncbi:MAG TPA: homocysteine S-methyltransferase family protein [Candidatus Polarisedimenticolia bacterium]|nr:homocysteine S-methyltransferase family protein [Candidatus Polarisedimenticolia bacterium]